MLAPLPATCLLLTLGLAACAAGGAPPPAPGGPFGAPPPPAQPPSFLLAWIFAAGLGTGGLLAWLWRRRSLGQGLRHPGGRLLPPEVGRLRAALVILEELILAAGRRGAVVRLKDWLRAKGRGPGPRL